jgi:hypothetical protein
MEGVWIMTTATVRYHDFSCSSCIFHSSSLSFATWFSPLVSILWIMISCSFLNNINEVSSCNLSVFLHNCCQDSVKVQLMMSLYSTTSCSVFRRKMSGLCQQICYFGWALAFPSNVEHMMSFNTLTFASQSTEILYVLMWNVVVK